MIFLLLQVSWSEGDESTDMAIDVAVEVVVGTDLAG